MDGRSPASSQPRIQPALTPRPWRHRRPVEVDGRRPRRRHKAWQRGPIADRIGIAGPHGGRGRAVARFKQTTRESNSECGNSTRVNFCSASTERLALPNEVFQLTGG